MIGTPLKRVAHIAKAWSSCTTSRPQLRAAVRRYVQCFKVTCTCARGKEVWAATLPPPPIRASPRVCSSLVGGSAAVLCHDSTCLQDRALGPSTARLRTKVQGCDTTMVNSFHLICGIDPYHASRRTRDARLLLGPSTAPAPPPRLTAVAMHSLVVAAL